MFSTRAERKGEKYQVCDAEDSITTTLAIIYVSATSEDRFDTAGYQNLYEKMTNQSSSLTRLVVELKTDVKQLFNECSFNSKASKKDNYMYEKHSNLEHKLQNTKLFSDSSRTTGAKNSVTHPSSFQSMAPRVTWKLIKH